MSNISALMTAYRIGNMPSVDLSPVSLFAALGAGTVGYLLGQQLHLEPVINAGLSMASMLGLWVGQRFHTRFNNNDGWFFLTDPPTQKIKVTQQHKGDMELSSIYQEVFGELDIVVEPVSNHPRFMVHVIYHDNADLNDGKKQSKLARKLGVETELGKNAPFQVIQSWGNGASALVFPKYLADGERPTIIPFYPNKVVKGELVSFLGIDVRGRDIKNNRRMAPHMMISGTTGAGKTVLFRNEVVSMKLSAPNAVIYSIDLKGGLSKCPNTKFTKCMEEGLTLLLEFIGLAERNWAIVEAAGFDNWFEYNDKNPNKLAPLFLNIDELPQLVAQGDTLLLERWNEAKVLAKENQEPAPIKPKLVWELIGKILQVYRSGGAFVTIGIQDPKAEDIPTKYRSLFDARAAMRVSEAGASRVAIEVNGAENLPEQGGVMFRLASRPIQVGAAAFITESFETLKAQVESS